jgi:hypothetical protein
VRWRPAWELVSWSIELVARQSPASKHVNTAAEEAKALTAVSRRQPAKRQQTESTSYVL